MKRSKFTEPQIIKAIKENEAGRSAEEISQELGINLKPQQGYKHRILIYLLAYFEICWMWKLKNNYFGQIILN